MEDFGGYNCYLFDADGTLTDTGEMVYQSFYRTCLKYGKFEITKERVLSLMGIPFIPQLEEYLGRLSDSERTDIRAYFKRYQDSIYKEHLNLFPKVKDTLKMLKSSGKKLGVVSSRTGVSLIKFLKYLEIFDLFDIIVYPELTEKHKPDPEPVLYALEKLNIPPGETLFIGDAEFDIKSGRSAGVDTALVAWGPHNSDDLESTPNFILEDMEQLL